MNLSQLAKWLRRTPQPKAVLADGKRIEVGTGGNKWAEMHRSLQALGATKIECLDPNGNLIRAITLEDGDDAEGGDKKTELQSDLHALSKIIADAYEKGTKAPALLLESAMSFIERQSQRLVAQDREIERLRGLNARMSAEILQLKALPPEGDGAEGGILSAIAQGFLQSQGENAPNGVKVAK